MMMTTDTEAAESVEAVPENGRLTTADEYRREVSVEMTRAMKELHERTSEWEDLKREAKEAKSDVDAAQRRVNRLADDLRDIELGQFQPELKSAVPPEKTEEDPATEAPADEAADTPVEELRKYGLTPNQLKKLQESDLGIATIGDLENVMRGNEWWHREISGIGETGVTAVVDALVGFRQDHPIPAADESEEPEADADGDGETEAEPSEPEERRVDAWHDGEGQLIWLCPQCLTENPDTAMACLSEECEFVRPPLERLNRVDATSENNGSTPESE